MSEELPRVGKSARLVITEESLTETPQPSTHSTAAASPPPPPSPTPPPPSVAAPPSAASLASLAPPVVQSPLPVVAASHKPGGQGAYCSACGNPIDPRAMVCPRCGVAAPGALTATAAVAALTLRSKSTGMAILLSLFLPGAGQLYVGRTGRGIAFFCAAIFAYVMIVVLIGLLLVPVIAIWAAIDANKLATQYNAQLLAGVPLT